MTYPGVLWLVCAPRRLLQCTVLWGSKHYALIFPVAWLVTPYRKIVGEPGGGAAGCTCLAALINLSYKGRKVIDSDTDTVDSGERQRVRADLWSEQSCSFLSGQLPVCQREEPRRDRHGETACFRDGSRLSLMDFLTQHSPVL